VLSAADLASLRSQVQASYPDSCSTLRRTLVADGSGGYTETWATLDASVACRVDMDRREMSEEMDELAREYQSTPIQVKVPDDQDVRLADRLGFDGATYEVRRVPAEHAWMLSKVVLATEVE